MFAGNIPSPTPSPTFNQVMSFPNTVPTSPSRLERVRQHTRKLSVKLYGYHAVPYTDIEPTAYSEKLSFALHEQPLSQHPVHPLDLHLAKPCYTQSRDSITLGGGESSESDKMSAH